MLKLRYLLLASLLVWIPVSAEETKTLVWPDGTRYVGGVKDGKRSGKGTIFWQDGTRFVGTFVDDQRNGPGTMILPDGTVYNGYFENDELVQQASASSEPTAPVAEISADDVTAPVVAAAERETPQAEPEVAEPEPVAAPQAPLPTLTVATRQDVQAAIDAWAAAWSAQDVDAYLSAYATDFAVPGRQSRRQWEGLRRSRLTRPNRIDVQLTYDKFEMIGNNQVQVDFNQVYDSNLFSDRTNKRLVLVEENGAWKIASESSL